MTDWADEIASEMYIIRGNIAAALRKAKAAGMRMACDEIGVRGGYQTLDLMQAIRAQADKIEKGET